MTDEELTAIEERCNAATDGPWARDAAVVHVKGRRSKILASCAVRLLLDATVDTAIADAEFIAHARTDIPILLAEIKRLKEYERMYKDLQD